MTILSILTIIRNKGGKKISVRFKCEKFQSPSVQPKGDKTIEKEDDALFSLQAYTDYFQLQDVSKLSSNLNVK